MRDGLWTKGLVVGIIVLFIGTSVLPSIRGNLGEITKSDSNSLNQISYEKTNFNNDLNSPKTLGFTDDLVGYWSFDNQADVGHDDSNNGYQGVNNGATWVSDGKIGGALSFDGINDYVQFSSPVLNVPPYSVCAWVKASSLPNSYIINNGGQTRDSYGFFLMVQPANPANGWEFGAVVQGGNQLQVAYSPASTGNWYFLVGTWDGSPESNHVKLYVNGAPIGTYLSGGPWPTGPANNLRMGVASNILQAFFNGILDEVRIYNRVLTQDDITTLYGQGNQNAGLVGYWSFDEGSGTIAHDTSGFGNDGTIVGASWVPGKIGTGLEIKNTNYVGSIPSSYDDSITTAFTVAAWVKWYGPSSYPHDCIIFDGRGTDPVGFAFGIQASTGKLYLTLNQGTTGASGCLGISTIPIGSWTHVAVVFDDTSNVDRLYINGNLDNTTTTTFSHYNSDHSAAIGNNHWAPSDGQWAPLNGIEDEVYLYNKVLTKDQIQQLAGSGGGNQPVIEIGSITGVFGVSAFIKNTGTGAATNVPWWINISGGIILSGRNFSGTIPELAVNASKTIKSSGLWGIGSIAISVQVGDVSKQATAFLLGPLVLGVKQQ
jgi:hypothetical protein